MTVSVQTNGSQHTQSAPASGVAAPLTGKPAVSGSTPRCPRRIVLLNGDEHSDVEQVLAEFEGTQVSGKRLHEDVRLQASRHPGRQVAAEWLGPLGWTRFLWCRR
jgi:hypothetical protein